MEATWSPGNHILIKNDNLSTFLLSECPTSEWSWIEVRNMRDYPDTDSYFSSFSTGKLLDVKLFIHDPNKYT